MRVRPMLIATAILSSILGAVVAYLVLTVPNDLQAGALFKAARRHIEAGENDLAREELSRIIQQYPRTDAAAAATVALATVADSERHMLMNEIGELHRTSAAQQKQIADLTARVTTLAATPPPAPVVAAPVLKKAAAPHGKPRTRRHR